MERRGMRRQRGVQEYVKRKTKVVVERLVTKKKK